jgi:hypothetical protein
MTSVDSLNAVRAFLSVAAHPAGGPLVPSPWGRVVVVTAGYVLTMALSGVWVRFFVPPIQRGGAPAPAGAMRFDSGAVIGKCENVLALTFILAGDTTALGLLFAAKSLVRTEDIKQNPSYYLGGFLVNVVWSVIMGYVLRALVVAR